MTVLICGSRSITDQERLREIATLIPGGALVIHGAARGVDTILGAEAATRGHTVHAFPAEWDKHGKSAGFVRNIEMLKMLDPTNDFVLAVWDGVSRGTKHTIDEAKKRGIQVVLVYDPGDIISG